MDPIKSLYPPMKERAWDLRRTAFLMVDLQYFDAHREWGEGKTAQDLEISDQLEPFFSAVDELLPRLQLFLSRLRRVEAEVLHIRVAERTRDCRDVGLKQRVRGLFVPMDSKEAEFLPEVAPVGDEMVFSKSASGVFPWTALDRILHTMEFDHLVFAGVSTGGCVESAVRDAADMGYWVTVLSDGCADSTEQSHQDALRRMAGGRVQVATIEEVLRELKQLPTRSKEPMEWPRKVIEQGEEGGNPYHKMFGPPVEPPLSPSKSAVLLLDYQRFCADPDGGLAKLARTRGMAEALQPFFGRAALGVERAAELLKHARQHGFRVIHLRQMECLPDSQDAGANRRAKGFLIPAGSQDAQFVSPLVPIVGEVVLSRSCEGAFTRTGLEQLLRDLRLDTLILLGMNYTGAVEGTLRSATDRGYPVVLVAEACVSSSPELDRRLHSMESGLTRVLSIPEVVERMKLNAPTGS